MNKILLGTVSFVGAYIAYSAYARTKAKSEVMHRLRTDPEFAHSVSQYSNDLTEERINKVNDWSRSK